LRRLRFTGAEIAELLSMAPSTVSGILTRIGMGKLGRLGLEPARRYERERPGELVHVDVKKLGRIQGGAGKRVRGGARSPYNTQRTDRAGRRRNTVGWEFVHIAIDDCTRLAYAEVLPDEKAKTALAFLRRALAFFRRHGIEVERLLTDNGSAYRSRMHALACRALGIRHLRTRPYRPQTNGKAERFIRTLLSSWAYGAIYRTSSERTAALDGWLWHYNHHRKHSALGHKPPAARLAERNNLPRDLQLARRELSPCAPQSGVRRRADLWRQGGLVPQHHRRRRVRRHPPRQPIPRQPHRVMQRSSGSQRVSHPVQTDTQSDSPQGVPPSPHRELRREPPARPTAPALTAGPARANQSGGCAATACHAEGRGFESLQPLRWHPLQERVSSVSVPLAPGCRGAICSPGPV
jgi:transposase InsO family protein